MPVLNDWNFISLPPQRPIRVERDPAAHTVSGNAYRDGTMADITPP